MSDYRRFVSYMYLYENNIKSMNAGFLKVECRQGQCRLNLSLKNVFTKVQQNLTLLNLDKEIEET